MSIQCQKFLWRRLLWILRWPLGTFLATHHSNNLLSQHTPNSHKSQRCIKQNSQKKDREIVKNKSKVRRKIVNLISLITFSLSSTVVRSLKRSSRQALAPLSNKILTRKNFCTYFTIQSMLWTKEEEESMWTEKSYFQCLRLRSY